MCERAWLLAGVWTAGLWCAAGVLDDIVLGIRKLGVRLLLQFILACYSTSAKLEGKERQKKRKEKNIGCKAFFFLFSIMMYTYVHILV